MQAHNIKGIFWLALELTWAFHMKLHRRTASVTQERNKKHCFLRHPSLKGLVPTLSHPCILRVEKKRKINMTRPRKNSYMQYTLLCFDQRDKNIYCMLLIFQNIPVVLTNLWNRFKDNVLPFHFLTSWRRKDAFNLLKWRSPDLYAAAEESFTSRFTVGLHFGIQYANCILNTKKNRNCKVHAACKVSKKILGKEHMGVCHVL